DRPGGRDASHALHRSIRRRDIDEINPGASSNAVPVVGDEKELVRSRDGICPTSEKDRRALHRICGIRKIKGNDLQPIFCRVSVPATEPLGASVSVPEPVFTKAEVVVAAKTGELKLTTGRPMRSP